MRIGEFSEKVGLPVSTLHFYERKGLLEPARNAFGHREYGESDVAWIAFINRLRATGMPLADIIRYARLRAQGDATLSERLSMLKAHRVFVEQNLARWLDNLNHLDDKIHFYEDQISGQSS